MRLMAAQADGRSAGPAQQAAERTAARYPTYYGDAWVALSGVHRELFPC